jgi:hypothetical protein
LKSTFFNSSGDNFLPIDIGAWSASLYNKSGFVVSILPALSSNKLAGQLEVLIVILDANSCSSGLKSTFF